jgi:hypothetical protein
LVRLRDPFPVITEGLLGVALVDEILAVTAFYKGYIIFF